LESNATTLIRTKGIDGKDHDIHLVEVVDEHTIRVEEDLSLWTGSVDAEGNVITQIETTTLTPEEYEALEDKTGCVANISGYQNANVVISVEEYNGVEDTTGYEEVIENYTKTATIYPGTQLFVYGQEVNDFVFLKKDAIWTVATSALQEVDRQLQAEKAGVQQIDRIQQQHDAQISDLESQLQEQASENRALRTALESLESRLESLESVVD
jgi:ubiquinone biosynthesis protein UbiJ